MEEVCSRPNRERLLLRADMRDCREDIRKFVVKEEKKPHAAAGGVAAMEVDVGA